MKYCFALLIGIAINVNVNAQTIGEIQGIDSASTYVNKIVTVKGVVTYTTYELNGYKGFYMQSAVADNDPVTSDGIFVFLDKFVTDVVVGDEIEVTSSVTEFFRLTQLTKIQSITKLGKATIAPLKLSHKNYMQKMESIEGMWVEFTDTFTVCGTYNLGRFGQLELSSIGKLYQPSNEIDINDINIDGNNYTGISNIQAIKDATLRNKQAILVMDDGVNKSNPAIIPFIDTPSGTIRSGSTVTNLAGVIDYAFGSYRIMPISNPKFNYAARPATPVLDRTQLSITSMNVLNYFTTLKQRGATTAAEFERQKTKIVAAMEALQTDVFALMEMENHPQNVALKDLTTGINTQLGNANYEYIDNPQVSSGTDAIKVAYIYNKTKVKPVGNPVGFSDAIFDRIPLAQIFSDMNGGNKFLVVANHFKSKGCGVAAGADADQLDGQGCWNDKRRTQAQELVKFTNDFAKQNSIRDILMVGDFNAYDQEDPLDYFRSEGYVSATENQYSYIFNSQLGALDHAFITPSVKSKTTLALKWNVNADEPICIDYNLENRTSTNEFYKPNLYRFSDHDPIILQWKPATITDIAKSAAAAATVELVQNANATMLTIHSTIEGHFTVRLYNTLGQLSATLTQQNGESLNLDSMVNAGCYQLVVTQNNVLVKQQKLILSK